MEDLVVGMAAHTQSPYQRKTEEKNDMWWVRHLFIGSDISSKEALTAVGMDSCNTDRHKKHL